MQHLRIGYFQAGTRATLLALGVLLISTGMILAPGAASPSPTVTVGLPELVIVLEAAR